MWNWIKRHPLLIPAGIAVLCVVCFALVKQGGVPDREADDPGVRAEQPQMDVRGVVLERAVNGRRLFRLRLGRFELEKKRLGPFSLGGTRQITIHNLELTLFLQPGQAADSSPGSKKGGRLEGSTNGVRPDLRAQLKDSLSGLGKGRVTLSGFSAENVVFRVLVRDEPLLSIRSGELSFLRRTRRFCFSEHVRLHWQGRTIHPGTVTLDPETMRFFTGNDRVISLAALSGQKK